MAKKRFKRKVSASDVKLPKSRGDVRRKQYRRGKQPRYHADEWTLDPESRSLRDLAEQVNSPHEMAVNVVEHNKLVDAKREKRELGRTRRKIEKRNEKEIDRLANMVL